MVSTKETADMERAIAALALELPAEVWEDVRDRWHAARDSLGAEAERLREPLAEITEACRSGKFYEDYDESCAIIARCDTAMGA